jgi:hypothetical protein
MPEALATADGRKLDLDNSERAFAAAMAAPRADEPEHPAPPKRAPSDPDAPYGRRVDGTPKKAPGGRPPKPREVEAPKDAKGNDSKAQGSAQDYARGLGEFLGGVQLVLAVVPIPNDNIRVHARYQSAVLEKTGDGLATGLGTVAEHNAMVRWGVEKLTQGGGAWIFPAVMAIAPFAVSTALLWNAEVTPEMAAGAERIEQEAMAMLKAEMGLDEEMNFAEQAPEPAAA